MKTVANLPRVGSAVILQIGGKVLLGLRNKESEKGKWVLPGGGIKPFESVKEAARRELQEETGLDIEVGEQVGVYEIIAPPEEHRVIVYSLATMKDGDLRPSSDSSQVGFFSREELRNIEVTPLVRKVLEDIGWL